ncbi:MAG: anti-sigma factor family protein [Candidatus Dormibacteraceae bacterium]
MTRSPAPLACARVRVLLESYVDGDLETTDAESAARVRAHLATCDDCRRQHHEAVSLPFRLKALASPTPPASLVGGVMHSIAPVRRTSRRAWTLLAPEAALVAFILWYLSGLQGLASLASGTWADLQDLAGWATGSAPLPSVPAVDVLLLAALIALTVIAAYHLSVLARLDTDAHSLSRPVRHERHPT